MSQDIKKALADETDQLVDRIAGGEVEGVIGGFPCQDISIAGNGAGLAGERSGLFWVMVEAIRLVRPKFWLMENVANLFQSGGRDSMGNILGTVAGIGYNAEWDCVGAGTVGAPHHRARAYILAHCNGDRRQRFMPRQICRQPEYDSWKDVRGLEELRNRPDLFRPNLRRKGHGTAGRLHLIGNGNPPCVIRELTKGLK